MEENIFNKLEVNVYLQFPNFPKLMFPYLHYQDQHLTPVPQDPPYQDQSKYKQDKGVSHTHKQKQSKLNQYSISTEQVKTRV